MNELLEGKGGESGLPVLQQSKSRLKEREFVW